MARPAPSLREAARYPVTVFVGIAAIAVSAASLRTGVRDRFVLDVRTFEGQPWRLVTSIFPHVDPLHLIFNLTWLWAFGTVVERFLGHARYVALLAALAIGSGTAEYAFGEGGVGLSGVGYGLFAFLWVLESREPSLRGVVDTRIVRLFVAWFFFCVATTIANVWNVGNYAHGAGTLIGALAGAIVAKRGSARVAATAGVIAVVATMVLGSTVARPYVNRSRNRGADSISLGYRAFTAHDLERAVHYDRIAVRMNPARAEWWWRLALAEHRRRDIPAALDAIRHAYAIAPSDTRTREAMVSILSDRALAEFHASRLEDAARDYREAARISPSRLTFSNVATTAISRRDYAEAEPALRRAIAFERTDRDVRALAAILATRAFDANAAGRRDEAIDLYQESLRLDEQHADIWSNLGAALIARRDWSGALDAYRRAATLNPDDPRFASTISQITAYIAATSARPSLGTEPGRTE